MRKVAFKVWIPIEYEGVGMKKRVEGTGQWTVNYPENGTFHQWAAAHEGGENFGNYTVALVELEDGKIVEVLPTNIKFLDKP